MSVKCRQDSTGGGSLDEFLERRFPESRSKTYVLARTLAGAGRSELIAAWMEKIDWKERNCQKGGRGRILRPVGSEQWLKHVGWMN
jgi:hypothetical protein